MCGPNRSPGNHCPRMSMMCSSWWAAPGSRRCLSSLDTVAVTGRLLRAGGRLVPRRPARLYGLGPGISGERRHCLDFAEHGKGLLPEVEAGKYCGECNVLHQQGVAGAPCRLTAALALSLLKALCRCVWPRSPKARPPPPHVLFVARPGCQIKGPFFTFCSGFLGRTLAAGCRRIRLPLQRQSWPRPRRPGTR